MLLRDKAAVCIVPGTTKVWLLFWLIRVLRSRCRDRSGCCCRRLRCCRELPSLSRAPMHPTLSICLTLHVHFGSSSGTALLLCSALSTSTFGSITASMPSPPVQKTCLPMLPETRLCILHCDSLNFRSLPWRGPWLAEVPSVFCKQAVTGVGQTLGARGPPRSSCSLSRRGSRVPIA